MIPSLPKLIGLAAVIWLVWVAFRMFETRQARSTKPDNDDRTVDPTSVDLSNVIFAAPGSPAIGGTR